MTQTIIIPLFAVGLLLAMAGLLLGSSTFSKLGILMMAPAMFLLAVGFIAFEVLDLGEDE